MFKQGTQFRNARLFNASVDMENATILFMTFEFDNFLAIYLYLC